MDHDRHADGPDAAGAADPATRDPALRWAGRPRRLTRPTDPVARPASTRATAPCFISGYKLARSSWER
ncbi:protein of unknown function [Methylorubrum extorquens DM4]|uniref:Uncharacterized protein n=1 Tax=Methylorubrum extorquens (strain DSM 6343 / CIP 106787 / DM4) TaxID=661410 RepID=C7CMI4_METED|nr:protein of unknown function [Methylorubrum extorquens DM4]